MPAAGCWDQWFDGTAPQRGSCTLGGGLGGRWVSSTHWAAARCPQAELMKPAEVASCLRGRALAFEGDSLTRQLMLRLVWFMRGLDTIVEHYFQSGAVYTFSGRSEDGGPASDHLRVVNAMSEHVRQAKAAHPRFDNEDDELVATLASVPPDGFTLVLRRPSAALARAHPFAAAAAAGRLAGVIRGSLGNFSLEWDHEHGRPRQRDWLSLDEMNACAGGHYFGRNAAGAGSLQGRVALHGSGARADQRDHGWERRAEVVYGLRWQDAHFQCSFDPRWPAEQLTGLKVPLNGDCRDLLGLNTVQALLQRVCR